MEHWGLVTFRETALLYDEKISSTANKQRVATVIAHEVSCGVAMSPFAEVQEIFTNKTELIYSLNF